MKVKMTREDVNQGRLIPNGEYAGTITAAEDGESGAGNEMLIVDIQVNGNPEYQGVIVRDWLGNWFRGADKLRRFIESITGAKYDYDKQYDLSENSLKGKKLKFYNRQGADNTGRPCNTVEDYKPIGAK